MLDSASLARVTPYLSGVSNGQNVDIRTPFWDKRPREQVLSEWDAIINPREAELPGRLMEIEVEQRSKVGPYSIRVPWSERRADLELYYDTWHRNVDCDLGVYHDSFHAQLRGRVEYGRLRPLGLKNAMQSLPRNTNSGLPYFTKRNKVEQQDLELAQNDEWVNFGCVVGWRGQASGLNELPKQRIVWMFPQSANIVEASYFRPLHDIFVVHPSFSAWTTPDGVDLAVKELLDGAKASGSPILSSDFSGFDQHLGPPITRPVFDLMSLYFQASSPLEQIEQYFHNVGIVTPDGFKDGVHGVPSGSTFTNMVDSLAHILMQYHVAEREGKERHPYSQVQGDDGLLVLRGAEDLDSAIAAYEDCGMDMNPEKQFIGTEDCTYLQRYHHVDWSAGGIYPTYRALSSLMGQERMHSSDEWGPAYSTLRAIMILENCKHHPLFVDFVRFVANGDKYGLGSKWPGGIKRFLSPDVLRGAAELPGFVPSYNQEDRISGIFTFKTVAIISEM
jgi:hypothetical protein